MKKVEAAPAFKTWLEQRRVWMIAGVNYPLKRNPHASLDVQVILSSAHKKAAPKDGYKHFCFASWLPTQFLLTETVDK